MITNEIGENNENAAQDKQILNVNQQPNIPQQRTLAFRLYGAHQANAKDSSDYRVNAYLASFS